MVMNATVSVHSVLAFCVSCVQTSLTHLGAATPTGHRMDSDWDLDQVVLAVEVVYRHVVLLIGARSVLRNLRTVPRKEVLVGDVVGGGVEGVVD